MTHGPQLWQACTSHSSFGRYTGNGVTWSMAFLTNLAEGGTTLSSVPLVLTILGSAAGGAAIAGFFTLANSIRQRRHERQRALAEARRLAYAQLLSAASGFLLLRGKAALAPESDSQLRTAYGATILLGSSNVCAAADALFAAAWNQSGPQAIPQSLRNDFLEAARKDLFS